MEVKVAEVKDEEVKVAEVKLQKAKPRKSKSKTTGAIKSTSQSSAASSLNSEPTGSTFSQVVPKEARRDGRAEDQHLERRRDAIAA